MTFEAPGTTASSGVCFTDSDVASSTLIPPRRLGALLSQARSDAGMTLEEIASLAQGRFTLSILSSIERGTWAISDEDARWLGMIYGIQSTSLVPPRSRLIVDLEEGFLQVDDYRAAVQRSAPSNDEVLARYLSMVYSMRRIDPGRTVVLRDEDIDVLGRALRMNTRSVAVDLEALMSRPVDLVRWRDRLLKRRVFIPAAGVMVAALSAGALVLVQGPDPVGAQTNDVPALNTSATLSVPVDIGTAIVQERNADGTAGEVQVRTGDEAAPVGQDTAVIGTAKTVER